MRARCRGARARPAHRRPGPSPRRSQSRARRRRSPGRRCRGTPRSSSSTWSRLLDGTVAPGPEHVLVAGPLVLDADRDLAVVLGLDAGDGPGAAAGAADAGAGGEVSGQGFHRGFLSLRVWPLSIAHCQLVRAWMAWRIIAICSSWEP